MTATNDPRDAPDLARLLERSMALHEALQTHFANAEVHDSSRSRLAVPTSQIAIEHGTSICMLVGAGNISSASILLRTQFEAVVRAIWLCFVAKADWMSRYWTAVRANPMKDPNFSPGMDEMLKAIAQRAPPTIAPQLSALKQAAWGPLNSFVHSGIHPVVLQHAGYPLDAALGNVRNANGLTIMAYGVIASLTDDRQLISGLTAIQRTHLDCCPPLAG